MRISSSSVELFSTIVGKWNTSGGERKCHSLLQASLVVSMIVKETRIVVVIDKDTEGIDILEVLGLLVISVTDVVHGFRATEDITDCVVHWVVEKCSQMVLIRSYVCRVSIEAFTHLEHACRFTVLRPKISWDFWNSVNPDSIEAILLNDALDPVL